MSGGRCEGVKENVTSFEGFFSLFFVIKVSHDSLEKEVRY